MGKDEEQKWVHPRRKRATMKRCSKQLQPTRQRGCLVHCLKWLTLPKVSRSIWRVKLRYKKLGKVGQVSHEPNSPRVPDWLEMEYL
jgi:hypothetical protein